jgi:hypothetical protein
VLGEQGALTPGTKDLSPKTGSLRLRDFAAANAGGADAHTLRRRTHAGVHRTQIYIPAPLGNVVGVADAVSELRLLAADITLLCHDCSNPFRGLTEVLILPDFGHFSQHLTVNSLVLSLHAAAR